MKKFYQIQTKDIMTGATPELHMKKKIAYLNENALKVVLRNDEKQTIFCSICFT